MTLLALLGWLLAALALWLAWLLADGLRALVARRRIEARRRRASTPLRLVVQARREIADGLFGLVLARADRRRLPAFLPGQYLTVCLPAMADGRQERRRYSLAAWQARPREYHLGIRHVAGGRVSAWLYQHARPGSVLEVLPPAGEFVLQRHLGDVVLVAGGIGLTPMAAMVDALARQCANGRQAWLFHAARSRDELADYQRYMALQQSLPGFHYRPWLSRPEAGWTGGRGRLDASALMRELAAPAAAQYYLCARREMMEALEQGLTAAGVPASAVHWESFGADGNPDANEYRVSIAGHGSHAFRGEPSLLHALESWGVPVKAECRSGSCGACRIDVRSGRLCQRQAPAVALPAGAVLACCAVPETDIEIVI